MVGVTSQKGELQRTCLRGIGMWRWDSPRLVGMIVFYVLITARSWKLTGKDMRNFLFYISLIALPEWTLLLKKNSDFSPSLLRQWQIELLYERHKCLRSALLSPSSKVSAWLPPQKKRRTKVNAVNAKWSESVPKDACLAGMGLTQKVIAKIKS